MFTFVVGLVVISLLGSVFSLVRISEVKTTLDAVNRRAIPLNRVLGQLQTDVDILAREMDRALGSAHWKDPHWKPRALPRWLESVLAQELERVTQLAEFEGAHLQEWSRKLDGQLKQLLTQSQQLAQALSEQRGGAEIPAALFLKHAEWGALFEEFRRQVAWGVAEHERGLRERFAAAEQRVGDLRTGMELVLVVIVALSLLLLWVGERALRPLGRLTRLAREITRRGLRKEDKNQLFDLKLMPSDEVGTLAQEFHRMATALLEREKTVESQKDRLEIQNAQLRQMGKLQERLQQAENLAAVGRLSAQVAHEVRNPLHAIGLEAELAMDALSAQPSTPQARESVQAILESVDRLQQITENYLKLSREGVSPSVTRPVELPAVLESTLALYSAECQALGIRIHWHLPETPVPAIHADAGLLEQAIGNLLRNAMQSLQESRTPEPAVTIEVAPASEGHVALRIRDNGPGIAPAAQEKLFEPFMTTRAAGTGLGLSFVRKVVGDWGGELVLMDARSACFELRLPVYTEAVEGVREESRRETHAL